MANSTCSIDECDSPTLARKMCQPHYRAWRKSADPSEVRAYRGHKGSAAERFWAKVDKTGDCWIWMAARDAHGYGRFRVRSDQLVSAHRFAYEDITGAIPDDLVIDHLCRNPSCVNPAHLEPVTQRENIRRSPTAPPGIRMRMTHCQRGHELAGENLYVTPGNGYRACVTCTKRRRRERADRLRNTAA